MIRLVLMAALTTPAWGWQAAGTGDVAMRAMRDELARSMKKLQLENLSKPYFIGYRAVETQSCWVAASFGALISSLCEPVEQGARVRQFAVEVRVGDYTRDNTNFFAPMITAGVVRPLSSGSVTMPLDDNYDEMRRQLWLATDSAYKNALDMFAKKKAALEHRTRTDDAPDFSHEAAGSFNENEPAVRWNRGEIEGLVKGLSALFRETRGVDNSEVRWSGTRWVAHFVNSEGSSFVRAKSLVSLQANADTQAADGMPLTDFEVAFGRAAADLPSREEMTRRIRGMAARLEKLRAAPLVERYAGPVLFEDQAAAELFLQGLGAYVTAAPRVVVEDARMERLYNGNTGLLERLGTRVLPEFLTLVDDPTLRDLAGKPLFGGYAVDDDGVKGAATTVVDRGVLSTLLHGRGLITGTTHSTASRRGMGAMPSNLVLKSEKGLSAEALKQELLRMVRQRNKEFGIVVRRMSNTAFVSSLLRSRTIIVTGGGTPGGLSVEPLLEAYKVYPDGREELVRNVEISGLTLGAFKDIVAVSDRPYVYTTQVRIMVRQPLMPASITPPSGPTVVSIAIPSLLFEDLALQRPSGDVPNLPFSKHPSFEK